MKIVINEDFGGFSLSKEAFEMLLKRKGIEYEIVESTTFGYLKESFYDKGHAGDESHYISDYDFISSDQRSDEDLVAVIEALGKKANGPRASLKVVEIPDDVDWYIEEYDGREHVAERHRTWS